MPELTPQEREHVLSCPECRTLAFLVEAGLPPAQAVGETEPSHVVGIAARARAPEGLADSVMERVLASADVSDAPAIGPLGAAQGSGASRGDRILRAIRIFVPLAAAAVLILLILPPSYRTITSRSGLGTEVSSARSLESGVAPDTAKGSAAASADRAQEALRADTAEFDGEDARRRDTWKAKEAGTGTASGPGGAMPKPGKKAQVLEDKALTLGDERPAQPAEEGDEEREEAGIQPGADEGVEAEAGEEKAEGEKGRHGTQVFGRGQVTLKLEAKTEEGLAEGQKQASPLDIAPARPAPRPEAAADASKREKLGQEAGTPQPLTKELAATEDMSVAADRLGETKGGFKKEPAKPEGAAAASALSTPSTPSTSPTPEEPAKAEEVETPAEMARKPADGDSVPGERGAEKPGLTVGPESAYEKPEPEPITSASSLSAAGKATSPSFDGGKEGGPAGEQTAETAKLAKGSPTAGAGTESPAAGAGRGTMAARGIASALRKSEALPSLEPLCTELTRLLKRYYPGTVVEKTNGRIRFACESATARKESQYKMAKEVEAQMDAVTSKVTGEITLHAGTPPLADQEPQAAERKPGKVINLVVTSSATKTYIKVRLSYSADTPKQFLEEFRNLFGDPDRLLGE
jgi:hypothetical protein